MFWYSPVFFLAGDESELGENPPPTVTPFPGHIDSHYHYQMQQQLYQQQQKQMMVPDEPQQQSLEQQQQQQEPQQLTLAQKQMNEKLKEQQQIIEKVQAEAKLHQQQMRLQQEQQLQQQKLQQQQQQLEQQQQMQHEQQQKMLRSEDHLSSDALKSFDQQQQTSSASLSESFEEKQQSSFEKTSLEATGAKLHEVAEQQRLMELQQQQQNDLALLQEQQQQQQQQLIQQQMEQHRYHHQQQQQKMANECQGSESLLQDDAKLASLKNMVQQTGYMDSLKEDVQLADENGNTPEDELKLDGDWYNSKDQKTASHMQQLEQQQKQFQYQQRIRSFEDKLCRGELPPSSPVHLRKFDHQLAGEYLTNALHSGTGSDLSDQTSMNIANGGVPQHSGDILTSALNNASVVNNSNNIANISQPIATSSPHILPSSLVKGSASCGSSPHTGSYATHSLGSSPHTSAPRPIFHGNGLHQPQQSSSSYSQQLQQQINNHHNSLAADYPHLNPSVQQAGPNMTSLSSSTLNLMKKQITEIEREIALRKPDGSSGLPTSSGQRRADEDSNGPVGSMAHQQLDLQLLDPLSKNNNWVMIQLPS